MKKTIKFDLPIDGVKVSTLDELRDHFTAEIVEHFRSGLLSKWLRSRRMNKQLDAVEALTANEDSVALLGLCEIFEIEADSDAISVALAEPSGASADDLAEELQIPAKVLLAYLRPSDSSKRTRDSVISSREKIELIRSLIVPTLKKLRTIALGEISQGSIIDEGECEVWVFETPLPGGFIIQTQGDLDTKGCLLDSSGNIVEEDDDSGDGGNFKMTCRLYSGLYFVLVRGFGSNTGSYSLHLHRASDDTTTTREVYTTKVPSFPFLLSFSFSQNIPDFHPSLLPLSMQLAALAKFREGNDR